MFCKSVNGKSQSGQEVNIKFKSTIVYMISGFMLFGGVILCLWGILGVKFYRDIQNEQALNMVVDLSREGQYTGRFRQEHSLPHGQLFYLDIQTNDSSGPDAENLFEGLKGHYSFIDAQGQHCYTKPFAAQTFKTDIAEFDVPGCVGYVGVNPGTPFLFDDKTLSLDFDEYTFVLTVEIPAMHLEGCTQMLRCTHAYCRTIVGLGILKFQIMMGAGIALMVLGVITLVSIWRRHETEGQ